MDNLSLSTTNCLGIQVRNLVLINSERFDSFIHKICNSRLFLSDSPGRLLIILILRLDLRWLLDINRFLLRVISLNIKKIYTRCCVRRSTKEYVNLLQRDLLGFRDEEPHICRQEYVDCHEEEQTFQTFIGQENWKKLLENGIGHVLTLTAHSDGLRSHVCAEDFGSVDPGGGPPRWLVEEGEQEEENNDSNTDSFRFDPIDSRGRQAYDGNEKHTESHTKSTDDEEEPTTVSIRDPHGIECEDDSKSGVQSVDQVDFFLAAPNLLVNGSRVGVERSLASQLLSNVDNTDENETLADGWVSEERGVTGSLDELSLEFDGGADGSQFFLDLLIRLSDLLQRLTGFLNIIVFVDVPSWRFRDEGKQDADEGGNKDLEENDNLPVPVAKLLVVVGAGIVDPVGDEATDRIVHLPESHDLSTDIGGRNLVDVDGSSSQSHALAQSNNDTSCDEQSNVVVGGKGLHKSGNDGHDATNCHTPSSTKVISQWPTDEEAGYDSADCVSSVDLRDGQLTEL